ncbi:hypothetical protein PAAG_07517 [Paracoccidioides lutzii Pb01]|uniref:Uncharacterized protein n=1 Tax=Paracoccidioides lutzii (strain ATCC MYA-826 / Pb01) TaxID=502779 RepID=C1H9S6_PARBA|nr:hypothetical protein PAAG_07517 [Paracoccidioides lutzii Pb01]EEH37099.2 hypothetical protein PAAG_07517 [Paracoccidioides lutzii Pb01]
MELKVYHDQSSGDVLWRRFGDPLLTQVSSPYQSINVKATENVGQRGPTPPNSLSNRIRNHFVVIERVLEVEQNDDHPCTEAWNENVSHRLEI